jgi:hypothetical protein
MSHGLMSEETIEAVLRSAVTSAGVRLLAQERSAPLRIAWVSGGEFSVD